MSEQPVAVGIADHNGWAILVCVAARDGIPVLIIALSQHAHLDRLHS